MLSNINENVHRMLGLKKSHSTIPDTTTQFYSAAFRSLIVSTPRLIQNMAAVRIERIESVFLNEIMCWCVDRESVVVHFFLLTSRVNYNIFFFSFAFQFGINCSTDGRLDRDEREKFFIALIVQFSCVSHLLFCVVFNEKVTKFNCSAIINLIRRSKKKEGNKKNQPKVYLFS